MDDTDDETRSGSGSDDVEGKRRATDDASDGDDSDDADDHDGVWC